MRFVNPSAGLLALGVLAALGAVGCSGGTSDDPSSEEEEAAYTGGAARPAACSLRYWSWVLNKLEPQLARPITELSDEQMTALVATHPPAHETRYSYGICWATVFDQYVYMPAAARLHGAGVTFIDQHSPDYRSYPRYRANIAMTPELRRNAKAVLALRPKTMAPSDVAPWMNAYDSVLAEVIRPVGVPGISQYEGVVEPEWVVTDAEAEYLAVIEKARAAPSNDGAYSEWVHGFAKWVFGPPGLSPSFVFNVAWEPGVVADSYGLEGLRFVNGAPTLPGPVQGFVDRLKTTMPPAVGSVDSAAWMSVYNARMMRALGDLSQKEPLVTKTDTLALDVLEGIKPATLRGASSYESWLDLYVLAASGGATHDASWATRIARIEPCLDAPDLAAAHAEFRTKTATLAKVAIAAPHVCAK